MYRIAICLSGQSRTYKQCLLNQKRLFENLMINKEDIQIDYYFHTWDTNQWTNVGSDKINLHLLPFEKIEIDINFVKSSINLMDYKIETFDAEKISNHWGPASYSMYYSNYLKRKREIKDGFRYDLVIKSRFDIVFNPNMRYSIFTPIEDHIMYTPSPMSRMDNELNYFNFDDVLFYGTSFTMDFLSDTYRYIKKNFDHHKFAKNIENLDLPVEFYFGPGCLLYRHATIWGLSPSKAEPLHYVIARHKVYRDNLDGITDFNKILEYHNDYYNNINHLENLI